MLLLTLAALMLTADPKPVEDPDKKPAEEKLIVKGDGYLIHAVRTGVVARGAFGEYSYFRDAFYTNSPLAITHINTTTGKMTRLASGGNWGGHAQMAVNRDFQYSQHIWGLASDSENLYLVLARKTLVTAYFGVGAVRPTATSTTTVQVFRLKDGELTQEIDLPKPLHTVDDNLTYDKLDGAPVSVTKEGLMVGDPKKNPTTFRFTEKRKLELEPVVEKK